MGSLALSASDMLAAGPVDAGSGPDVAPDISVDTGTPDTGDAGGDSLLDAIADENDLGDLPDPEPEPDLEAAPAEEPSAPAPPAPAKASDLPEGVRQGTDRSGKPEMRLTPQRYEKFHGAHKVLRDFEAIAGEPATPEALDLRQRAYIGQEKLYGDLLSADPALQGNVMAHILEEAKAAHEAGYVGTDPAVSLAGAFYAAIKEKSPDAYAHLRWQGAQDLVGEMYEMAKASKDAAIFRSTGHIARALGLKPKLDADMEAFFATGQQAQADPSAQLRAENQRLQQEISTRQTSEAAEQLRTWKAGTSQAVRTGVLDEAILPSLSAEQAAWAKFKPQFDSLVVNPLNEAVKQTIQADRNFLDRIRLLDNQASRASAQRRAEITGQIKQAYVQRALLAVESHKGAILRAAAAKVKEDNQATHQRREAAQNQRAPRGPQAPAQRSLIPGSKPEAGASFDPQAEKKKLAALFG